MRVNISGQCLIQCGINLQSKVTIPAHFHLGRKKFAFFFHLVSQRKLGEEIGPKS